MRIRKDNLKKLIDILQSKYDELEENEYYEVNNNLSISSKDDISSLPNHYLIARANNIDEGKIVRDFVNARLNGDPSCEDNDAWNQEDALEYYAEIENNIYISGNPPPISDEMHTLPIISIETIKKIINKENIWP